MATLGGRFDGGRFAGGRFDSGRFTSRDTDYIAAALATRAGIDWRPWQLSTLFTDTAGLVPASQPGDIIAVQKSPSKPGLQFQQTTLANRPVLVRHPKSGRRNRVESSKLTAWSTITGGTGSAPILNTIAASSQQTLPDGANGTDAGKGWTCTGLFHESGSLWWGNLARNLPAGSDGTRQIIRTNMAGTSILETVAIAEQPQGVVAIGSDLYYAQPSLGQVRRIAKAGGSETVVATITNANGLATDGTDIWVSSGSTVYKMSQAGVILGSFNAGVTVDHLFYDATNNWMWITSGANGAAGVLSIWSFGKGQILNTYLLTEAQAIEGIAVVSGSIYIAHDGYYHNGDGVSAPLQLNQLHTYSAGLMTVGLRDGFLADYVFFNRGAGNTSADISQLQVNSAVAGSRIASCYVWTLSGSGDIAMNVADSGGNTQEVKSITTTPTRFSTARALYTGPAESFSLRSRGGVTTSNSIGLFVIGAQVEAGASVTAEQVVRSIYDITEPGQSECWGLQGDGFNDGMATAATIDMSGSDRIAAFLGRFRNGTNTFQSGIEFGPLAARWDTVSGAFNLFTTGSLTTNLLFDSRGTSGVGPNVAGQPAPPDYCVLTLLSHISGPGLIGRRNASQILSTATTQGTGNFGNHTVTILDTQGGNPSAGIDWGGAVISGLDATTDAALIAAIEKQIATNVPGVVI